MKRLLTALALLAFAIEPLSLLADDGLWDAQHAACLAAQRSFGWSDAAAQFERLIPVEAPMPRI